MAADRRLELRIERDDCHTNKAMTGADLTRPFRLAVVNSHPIQYFAPLYAYLNRDPTLEVTAIYCSDFSLRGDVDAGFKRLVVWDVDLLSGYRSEWLGDRAKTRRPAGFWSLVCPEMWYAIRSGQYDAVLIHGYSYAAYVLALLAAKSCGVPVLFRTETHLGLHRTPFRQWMRDFVLSRAYRFVDGFLAIGSRNRTYYRSLGVPEEKIFDAPYTVDNDRFIAAARLTQRDRDEVRSSFGVPPDTPVVLYASKFARRKHADDLIRAMAQLRTEGIRASLLLVGTGEMEKGLRDLASQLRLKDVAFAGFVNQRELPRVLAASDVFVLPAENEPWGLIVNEAMCAGLPVVVGKEVGCVPDLVVDGENGYLVTAGDPVELAAALRPLVGSAELRRRMGSKSLERIREWNYERCREGIWAFATRRRLQ